MADPSSNKSFKNKEIFFGAKGHLFDNARLLRESNTEAEKKLWSAIRGRKLDGLKFRRQHPIDKYIADFYCPAHELVIELDGGIHNDKEVKEHDSGREFDLKGLGIKIIRFNNEEVINDLNTVLTRILESINSRS